MLIQRENFLSLHIWRVSILIHIGRGFLSLYIERVYVHRHIGMGSLSSSI